MSAARSSWRSSKRVIVMFHERRGLILYSRRPTLPIKNLHFLQTPRLERGGHCQPQVGFCKLRPTLGAPMMGMAFCWLTMAMSITALRLALRSPCQLSDGGPWHGYDHGRPPAGPHPLKMERHREDSHGRCASMTRTNRSLDQA